MAGPVARQAARMGDLFTGQTICLYFQSTKRRAQAQQEAGAYAGKFKYSGRERSAPWLKPITEKTGTCQKQTTSSVPRWRPGRLAAPKKSLSNQLYRAVSEICNGLSVKVVYKFSSPLRW